MQCWLGLPLQVPVVDIFVVVVCFSLFSFFGLLVVPLFPPKFSFTEKLFTSLSLAIVFVQLHTRIFIVYDGSPSKASLTSL